MGVKLILVCGLALLMTIPVYFVGGLVDERMTRGAEVTKEVSGHVGGAQTFLGPTLAIPYAAPKQGVYLVYPSMAVAEAKAVTEERHRSLFRVPVFQADLRFEANFDLAGVPVAVPEGAVLDWNRAEIVVGASDARGALADGRVTLESEGLNTRSATLVPAASGENLALHNSAKAAAWLVLFGANATDFAKPNGKFRATATLRFSGAERIAVLAYGKSTRVKVRGDWRNPGFDGGILPMKRMVSDKGFTAEWSVPFVARGIRAEGPKESMGALGETAMGVSFVELADPYQSVSRALKYALLFLGMVFLSYFVFEATTGTRVHPAQYLLVGVAQVLFYLLLLSLAERVGFDVGFLLASSVTVGLLATNAGWVFASRREGARALVSFSLLYGLIFEMLRLEDGALLVGAIASFGVVAAVMYFTRGIDWYGSFARIGSEESAGFGKTVGSSEHL